MKAIKNILFGSKWEIFQMILICASIFFFGTVGHFNGRIGEMMMQADVFCGIFFLIDFVFRIAEKGSLKKSFSDFFLIIDALTLIGYVFDFLPELPYAEAWTVLRVLKILTLFRFIPLTRSFIQAFSGYKEEFLLFACSFLVVLIMGSFGIYRLEGMVNPEFANLGDSLWWSVVTMSTVGYGDAIPITRGGKILSGMVMIFGLATMAMLTGMITKVFFDHFFGKKREMCKRCRFPHHDFDATYCKNCGESL